MRRRTRTTWKAKLVAAQRGDAEMLQLYYWPTEALSLSAELGSTEALNLAQALRRIAGGQKLDTANEFGSSHFGSALITESPYLHLHFIAILSRDGSNTGSASWRVELNTKLARTIADAIDEALAPAQQAAA